MVVAMLLSTLGVTLLALILVIASRQYRCGSLGGPLKRCDGVELFRFRTPLVLAIVVFLESQPKLRRVP